MGVLIAKGYPTKIALDAADHTYVACGTGGQAWGCWGGKSGGTELARGTGSTNRANEIARPDERAGITCYLINGVCHQAANRVLLPAGTTVRGARGYGVSEALYGVYGKLRLWPCRAPFERFPDVTGDLPACTAPEPESADAGIPDAGIPDADERAYLEGVWSLYAQAGTQEESAESAQQLPLELFRYMAAYRLGPLFDESLSRRLMHIRGQAERAQLETDEAYAQQELPAAEFVELTNSGTIAFQNEMAEAMTAEAYLTLLGLEPGEVVVLADPDIVRRAFPE